MRIGARNESLIDAKIKTKIGTVGHHFCVQSRKTITAFRPWLTFAYVVGKLSNELQDAVILVIIKMVQVQIKRNFETRRQCEITQNRIIFFQNDGFFCKLKTRTGRSLIISYANSFRIGSRKIIMPDIGNTHELLPCTSKISCPVFTHHT